VCNRPQSISNTDIRPPPARPPLSPPPAHTLPQSSSTAPRPPPGWSTTRSSSPPVSTCATSSLWPRIRPSVCYCVFLQMTVEKLSLHDTPCITHWTCRFCFSSPYIICFLSGYKISFACCRSSPSFVVQVYFMSIYIWSFFCEMVSDMLYLYINSGKIYAYRIFPNRTHRGGCYQLYAGKEVVINTATWHCTPLFFLRPLREYGSLVEDNRSLLLSRYLYLTTFFCCMLCCIFMLTEARFVHTVFFPSPEVVCGKLTPPLGLSK